MARRVKLSHVESVLAELSYPVSREEAVGELSGITLLYADGEGDLGDIVADTNSASFDSVDDLEMELYEFLPVDAVGEPGQSEGEG